MKRGGPLKRSTRLAVDPSKVAEFNRRAKARARESTATGPPAARAGTEAPTMAWALRAPFKARRAAKTARCFRCNRQAHAWHHWLPQRVLREYARHVGHRDRLGPSETRRMLSALLKDEANLSGVCRAHHDEHEHPGVGSVRFTMADVPASAVEFADGLGPEWVERLRRAYG